MNDPTACIVKFAAVLCCCGSLCFGLPPLPVELGSPAKPLATVDWVTTPPASIAWGAIGKITVVEFWATWCTPCRFSIPHLAELQDRYTSEGVTIVGISTEEKNVVADFVAARAGEMRYLVGVDRDNSLYRAYMRAFDVKGIPHAFIVSADGRILWHGHPLRMDEPLAAIVDNRYDLEKMRMEDRIARYSDYLFNILSKPTPLGEKKKALASLRELIDMRPTDMQLWGKVVEMVSNFVLPNADLRAEGLSLAHHLYQKKPKWYPATNLYYRFLDAEGKTSEALALKPVVEELQRRHVVAPILPRAVSPAARQTPGSR
ncbi:MAG: TlpA family protein disulfide reductase [Candidatus Sumerlaeaceae bacterium]|nr:TlpA family protein disulfide reductase [Candidatus Sumerlaeaceae bacterium]